MLELEIRNILNEVYHDTRSSLNEFYKEVNNYTDEPEIIDLYNDKIDGFLHYLVNQTICNYEHIEVDKGAMIKYLRLKLFKDLNNEGKYNINYNF